MNKVEAVAKAIWDYQMKMHAELCIKHGQEPLPYFPWEKVGTRSRAEYIGKAEAAIEALEKMENTAQ